MKIEAIKIPHDGRVSYATVYTPDGEGCFPFVVLSHGYNGHGDDCRDLAEKLAEAGIGAVTHTFCGGSTRDESGFPTCDMTIYTECEDLSAVVDAVRALPSANGVAIWGESQGGLVTAMTAGVRPSDFFAVGLLYPAFCIPDNWREAFPEVDGIPEYVDFWGMRLGKRFFMTLRNIRTESVIDGYKGPVLILQGTDDPIVRESDSVYAAERYENAHVEIFPGEGHGFSHAGRKRMIAVAVDFFRRNSQIKNRR